MCVAVRSCAHLQVLELERLTDLGLQVATELCKAGLKSLDTLVLTHTPVSSQAILHFHSETRPPTVVMVTMMSAVNHVFLQVCVETSDP